MSYSIYEILAYFLIYSFAGWCIEVIYHAVVKGKFINRGFEIGPICPIYGCIFRASEKQLDIFVWCLNRFYNNTGVYRRLFTGKIVPRKMVGLFKRAV